MFGLSKKERQRKALVRRMRSDELEYIDKFADLKDRYENNMTIYEKRNEEVLKDNERLRIKAMDLRNEEIALDEKRKLVAHGKDPAQLFISAMDKAMDIAWKLNQQTIEKAIVLVKQQVTKQEQEKYQKAIDNFLSSFEYKDKVATPETILKIKKNLEEDMLIAERRKDKEKIEQIINRLTLLKDMGIIK